MSNLDRFSGPGPRELVRAAAAGVLVLYAAGACVGVDRGAKRCTYAQKAAGKCPATELGLPAVAGGEQKFVAAGPAPEPQAGPVPEPEPDGAGPLPPDTLATIAAQLPDRSAAGVSTDIKEAEDLAVENLLNQLSVIIYGRAISVRGIKGVADGVSREYGEDANGDHRVTLVLSPELKRELVRRFWKATGGRVADKAAPPPELTEAQLKELVAKFPRPHFTTTYRGRSLGSSGDAPTPPVPYDRFNEFKNRVRAFLRDAFGPNANVTEESLNELMSYMSVSVIKEHNEPGVEGEFEAIWEFRHIGDPPVESVCRAILREAHESTLPPKALPGIGFPGDEVR